MPHDLYSCGRPFVSSEFSNWHNQALKWVKGLFSIQLIYPLLLVSVFCSFFSLFSQKGLDPAYDPGLRRSASRFLLDSSCNHRSFSMKSVLPLNHVNARCFAREITLIEIRHREEAFLHDNSILPVDAFSGMSRNYLNWNVLRRKCVGNKIW